MKILIVKNRYTKKIKLTKGLDWFKKNTPLEMTVEEMSTDFDLEFIKTGNQYLQALENVVVDTTKLYPKLRNVIPENRYDVVVLYYGNDAPGIRLSMCSNVPLYPDTGFLQVVKDDDGKTFNHELIHECFRNLRSKGIILNDPMDVVEIGGVLYHYYNDNSLTSKHSNRTIAVELLKPHWGVLYKKIGNVSPVPEKPLERQECASGDFFSYKTGKKCPNLPERIVTIKRSYGKEQTTGELSALNNGATFACQTLELKWLDNAKNISCVPAGKYQCKMTFSPKRLKNVYQLQNVPGRSSIQFHSGNYAAGKIKDIEGCILLGTGFQDINKDGIPDIIVSRETVKAFEQFMGGKEFTLIII